MKIDNRYISLKLIEKGHQSKKHLNHLILDYFNNNNYPSKDKIFINTLVLGSVRMRGKSNYIVEKIYKGKFSKLKLKIKEILSMAIYQIDYMDSVPDYAALSSSVDITKKLLPGLDKLVNAVLRKYLSQKEIFKPQKNNPDSYQLLSHPKWLIDRWTNNYGITQTFKICNFNNAPQKVWFRANYNILMKDLEEEIKSLELSPSYHKMNNNFFYVSNSFKLISSKLFKEGYISIQNPINGFIVELLKPDNSDDIIDGCSSPGGKGSLISALAPKSNIISIEKNQKRVKKIEDTIKRQKISNITIELKDLRKDAIRVCNKILLDVPCTGTGVSNRRVDLRWKRTPEDLESLNKIQYEILVNSSKYLSSDGILVYSTCSIEPEENEKIIDKFIKEYNFIVEDASDFVNNNIVKDKAIKVLPGEHNLDGGYAVRLKREM